jgi:hypothetical protein
MSTMSASRAVLMLAMLYLFTTGSAAQEMTPRSYWPAPKGIKLAVFGYSHSFGDVLTDPSLPIYGQDSNISTGLLGYLQIFSLWERTANILVELPYSWGTTKGLLEGDRARRDFSGMGDLGVTFAVNLLGAPSMSPAQFQELRDNPHPILGTSVKVIFPTGQYDPDRLINVGANRWAVKPEIGYLIPLRRKWILEFEAGAWFFGDDDEYLPGERKQEPVFALEAHVVKRFKPGLWSSLDLNYFTGGRQTIGGVQLVDIQRNSRIGATVVVPFADRHAIKVAYSVGVVTTFGTEFQQFLVSYQLLFR